MQKRNLTAISIITVAFLILIGTGFKPFNIMITLAQQYVDAYNKDTTDLNSNNNISNDTKQPNDNQIKNTAKPNKSQYLQIAQDPQLIFENATIFGDDNQQIVVNVDSLLVLVNKNRNLPADYIPKDLIMPNVNFSFEGEESKKHLREEAAFALEKLFEAAQKDKIELFAASGYRSYQRQKDIFDYKASCIGEDLANIDSAVPGQSEHQTGLAMDITSFALCDNLSKDFGEMAEGIWVKENGHKYGFIIRYPKEKEEITGYSYEPWHLRYVGKETAKYLYENKITLEEYFAQVYNY